MLTDVLPFLSWSWDDWGWVPPEPRKSQEGWAPVCTGAERGHLGPRSLCWWGPRGFAGRRKASRWPGRLFPKAPISSQSLFQGQVQQVLAGTLQPCKHHNPELQKISKWTDISVPGLIQLLPLTLDTVFSEPLIQTFHPGNTSSGQPLSKLDALLPQSHTVSSLDIQLDRPY